MYVDLNNSKPTLVYETDADPLISNMYLSLNITYGGWWFNPSFGIKKELLQKNTTNSKAIVKDVIADAFQWIIDAGKAKSFIITIEFDNTDMNRINIEIVAKKVNGETVKFSTFMSVV